MDPRDLFRDSDTVRILEIRADLIAPGGGPIKPIMNVCLPKVAGQMNLILNTQTHLGFPFNQNIELKAPPQLPPPPLVTWNVDEKGLNIPLAGTTITGIEGSLTFSFQEIPRFPDFACDNIMPRAVVVSFQTVGNENRLNVFHTAAGVNIALQNIQFIGGTAAERLSVCKIEVSIRPRKSTDGCRVWAREGQAVWFDAIITNLPSDAVVAFQWTVPGLVGSSTGPSVLVILPTAGTNVTVAVTVMATELSQTISKSDSLSFTVLSPEHADAIESRCRLIRLIQSYSTHSILLPGSRNEIPGFVDALWDEVPFFRTDGIVLSTESLRELFAATERLRIESALVAMSLEKVLSRGGGTPVASQLFRISGRIINQQTRQGVMGVRVEAWDKDLIFNNLVGSAMTDTEGTFRIEFSASYFQECFLDRQPDLFFKIFRGDALIHSTEDAVLWNVDRGETPVVIAVE
jgi:hypothetical protein